MRRDAGRPPRRPGARRALRFGERPDLPDVDVRAAGVGKPKVFDYARGGNPTRRRSRPRSRPWRGRARRSRSAADGGGDDAAAPLRPGDHVMLPDDVYGGTYRLCPRCSSPGGCRTRSSTSPTRGPARRRSRTPLVWLETPRTRCSGSSTSAPSPRPHTRPVRGRRRQHVRHPRAAAAARARCRRGRPQRHEVHRRSLRPDRRRRRHSDPEWIERLGFLANAFGAVPGPMDCFLGLRGLKTLALRMAKHSENAATIAAWLGSHPKVRRVLLPRGSSRTRVTTVASEQMSSFGGMVSFRRRVGR